MKKLNDYVLTAEAARILGVSQNTVRAWAGAGKLEVRRNPANGYRLFRREDLEQFLKQIDKNSRGSAKGSGRIRRRRHSR